MPSGDESMIIIGGGVGPMAGIALHRKIVEKTPAPEGDHQHRSVIHLSLSRYIPDRTEYLLNLQGQNSGKVMGEFVAAAASSFRNLCSDFMVGVPCNTFHAELIYRAFLETLARKAGRGIRITPVHMINATLRHIGNRDLPRGSVGLLATTGTRMSGVWRKALEKEGYSVVEPSREEQDRVHGIIYSAEWGIKAFWPPREEARRLLEHYLTGLAEKGAELIILGCTELPLASPRDWSGPELLDPVDCLADSLVQSPVYS